MKVLAFAAIAVVMSACSLDEPQVAPAQPVPVSEPMPPPGVDAESHAQIPDELPQVFINGEPGYPASWTWKGDRLDRTMTDPGFAGAVAAPFELELPPVAIVVGIRAIAPGVPGERDELLLAETGTGIPTVPDGWIMLSVAVRFPDGGGEYFWALNRPPGTPRTTPEAP